MSAHTPGPWKITREHKSPCSIESDKHEGAALAKVYLTDPATRKRADEFIANAQLIAAAPAMAEALADLIEAVRLVRVRGMRDIPELVEPHERACVVLATARGEA